MRLTDLKISPTVVYEDNQECRRSENYKGKLIIQQLVHEDNQATLAMTKNPKFHGQPKDINI